MSERVWYTYLPCHGLHRLVFHVTVGTVSTAPWSEGGVTLLTGSEAMYGSYTSCDGPFSSNVLRGEDTHRSKQTECAAGSVIFPTYVRVVGFLTTPVQRT